VIVNFANADMVGHSGMMEPTIKAVEAVDAQLARIYQAVKAANASWVITADHGNAEMLIDPVSGGPHTAHTTNPVPFLLVSEAGKNVAVREGGSLRDISPTILSLMEMNLPAEMTGGDLRVKLG
jgi:2,3-bisphosphoglycerate-independent phosphoglycerate mutase